MPLYEFQVTLEIEGPVLTRSSVPSRWGIDAPFAKAGSSRHMIPWTLVKGRLLESWKELEGIGSPAFQPDIDGLLGVATGTGSASQTGAPPRRGKLRGTDFVLTTEDGPVRDRILYRIQIDDERGAAEAGMYQVIESPLAPGERGKFVGVLSLQADEPYARKVETWLDKGLRWIPSVGALKSIGFGQVKSVKLGENSKAAGGRPTVAFPDHGRVCLAIQLDRPFEVSRSQPNSNLFESEVVIPGGVLKGALAATWAESIGRNPWEVVGPGFDSSRVELAQVFATIHVTHAFPEQNGMRPLQVPYSAVLACDGTLLDVALAEGPGLVEGRAPAFQVDWKDKDAGRIRKEFGWPDLKTDLRVRTAIENGVAEEHALFAYESVVPDGGRRWLFDIDMAGIPDVGIRAAAGMQLLALLGGGIRGIGKTKANTSQLEVLVQQPTPPALPSKERNDGFVVLVLQTDALLFDAQALSEASSERELGGLYRAYFLAESDNGLSLGRYFARQRLAGGWYIHERFQTGKSYHPLALTEAGSVFVLQIVDPKKAAKAIDRWRRLGLRLPASVITRLDRMIEGQNVPGSDWRNCPFVPENGWGEIAVDLAFHDSKRMDRMPGFNANPASKGREVAL